MESLKYKTALSQSQGLNETNIKKYDQQENLVSSYQLASKLRKIKENLDNSYFSTQSDANASIDEKFSSFLNTSSKSTGVASKSKPNYENGNNHFNSLKYSDFKSTTNPSTHLYDPNSFYPPVNSQTLNGKHIVSQTANNNPSVFNQIPSTRIISNNNFHLDNKGFNNKSSLDYILNQFDPESNKYSPMFTQNDLKNKNMNNDKVLIPIYNENSEVESIFHHQNNHHLHQAPQKHFDLFNRNENPNLVSLKQVIYTDNVSRQSSIRSLISNNDNQFQRNKLNNGKKVVSSNSNSIGSSSSGIVVTSDDNLNKLNKFNPQKPRPSCNQFSLSNGNLSPVYSKNENDLISYETNNKKNNNLMNLSQKNPNQVPNKAQTRFDYPNNSNLDIANFYQTNFSEYSDNVTIASSNSSGKYFPDLSEECESLVLVTPTNETNYGFAHIRSNLIKPDHETESVLSDFVSNLKFEENKNLNNNFNQKNLGNFFLKYSFYEDEKVEKNILNFPKLIQVYRLK